MTYIIAIWVCLSVSALLLSLGISDEVHGLNDTLLPRFSAH
jgi:hypothetical protein